MHELPITKSIFNSVIAHARKSGASTVERVCLEVGELREFIEEIVQKYWDYLSRGSIASRARIEIITIPSTARCAACQSVYPVDMLALEDACCPHCGHGSGELLTGRELRIRGIEIT
jgi:hydrogenase nickel incorporation protein HypA/HybF